MFDIDQYQTIPCTRNIIQNVKLGMQDTLDGSAFITLLFNTLNEPMNYQTTFGDKKGVPKKDEALTLLSVYHQVYEIQAIAEADAYTSISAARRRLKGKSFWAAGSMRRVTAERTACWGRMFGPMSKIRTRKKGFCRPFPTAV